MPLPLTVSCFDKIQIGLPFWYRLTLVVPDKGPLNGCVCVCVCVTVAFGVHRLSDADFRAALCVPSFPLEVPTPNAAKWSGGARKLSQAPATGPGGARPPDVFWYILGIKLHPFDC